MKFTLYSTPQTYLDAAGETLRRYEIQNNLFFRNIELGLAREDNSNMVMATVADDEGQIRICAIRTPPHPLLIFETDNQPQNAALELLAGSFAENGIKIDLFMTEKGLASRFRDFYGRRSGRSFAINESLVLYRLDHVNPLALPEGRFRLADEKDMAFLPYWFADFAPAAHVGTYDLDSGIEKARRNIENKTAYIWEDSLPVSMAVVSRTVTNCAIIAPVYTPPFFWGKGYATACVSRLSQKLLDDGWACCALFADCANPLSNKVYQKVGYQAIFYYDQYQLQKADPLT
jgi:uncharacterized protein